MTTYAEVLPTDTDVAVFIAKHFECVNLYVLPAKLWVARENGEIVALLMLNTYPYVAIDLIRADADARPFMRIIKLWRMAESWLRQNQIPVVCVSINDTQVHFQSLVKRLGFVKAGESYDDDGNCIETIFSKNITTGALLPGNGTIH